MKSKKMEEELNERYFADNLGLITFLMENQYGERLNLIGLNKNKLNLQFETSKLTLPVEEVFKYATSIKPRLTNLLKRIYGCEIQNIQLEGSDEIKLIGPQQSVFLISKRKDLINYIKEACETYIKTRCITHNIHFYHPENEWFEDMTLDTVLNALEKFDEGLKMYCPNGQYSSVPLSFKAHTGAFGEFDPEDIADDPKLLKLHRKYLTDRHYEI